MITLPEKLAKLRISLQQAPDIIPPEDFQVSQWVRYAGKELAQEFATSNQPRSVFAKMPEGDILRDTLARTLDTHVSPDLLLRKIVLYCQIKLSQLAAERALFRKAALLMDGCSAEEYVLHCARTRMHGLNFFKIPEIIGKAAAADNRSFFLALGRALSGKPVKQFDPDRLGKVEVFLVEAWFGNGHNGPDLCHFTDEALLDLLQYAFPVAKLTFDNVRKMRQRLKLKKAVPSFIGGVTVGKGEILFSAGKSGLP